MNRLIYGCLLFIVLQPWNHSADSLPSLGNRCAQDTVGLVDSVPQTPPNLETTIQNFQAVKGATTVSLSVNGSRVSDASDPSQLIDSNAKRVFWVVFRCNQGSSAATEWVTVTPLDGSSIFPSGIQTNAFPDTLSLVDDVSSEDLNTAVFYYLAFSAVSSSDSPSNISNATILPAFFGDARTYQDALLEMYTRAIFSGYAWTRNPLVKKVSFLPVQTHIVADLANPANSVIVSGFISTSSSPRLTDTILGLSVAHTLTATSNLADFTGNPAYSWSQVLSLDGSLVPVPVNLFFTPSGASLDITGDFLATQVDPGDYSLAITSIVTDSASVFNSTTTVNFAWQVSPNLMDMSQTAGSTLAFIEIGNSERFTISRSAGFSEGVSGPASFVTASWQVSNLSSTSLQFSTLTTSGNTAGFEVSFVDDEALVGGYSFDLTLTEICNPGAPSYCASMIQTVSKNFIIQALGHNFNFASTLRVSENQQKLSNYSDLNQYIPLYFDSTQSALPDFSSFAIKAVNMKSSSFSPLTTAIFQINSFLHNGVPQAIVGGQVSIGGLKISTPSAGTGSVTTLALTGALVPSDIFLMELTALSSSSIPSTTSITLGFIALEARAPVIVQSSVLDHRTGLAFAWPSGFSSSSFPARTDARISVGFSENVTGTRLRLDSGGTTGVTENMSPSTTSISFSTILSSGALLSLVATTPRTFVSANFSSALDQTNAVRKNILADTQTIFEFVRSPMVVNITSTQNPPIQRNGTLSLNFSEAVTSDLAQIRAGLVTPDFIDYSLSTGPNLTSALLSPLPGRDLILTGNTARINIRSGVLFNSAGFPNISTQVFSSILFEADLKPPLLLAISVASDDYLTQVTYSLTFDETLTGTVRIIYKNLTDGTQNSFTQIASATTFVLMTSVLGFDTEYQIILENVSDGTNATTVTLDPFLTLADSPSSTAEIQEAIASATTDVEPPFIYQISPDFRVGANQDSIPVRPLITLEFSEKMATSTTNSILLSDTPGAILGVGIRVESFDGRILVLIPSQDLSPGTLYYLSFNNQAMDASPAANFLPPTVFNFTTFIAPSPGAVDPNQAPTFLGHNMEAINSSSLRPRLYFSEPVDPASLLSAVVIRNNSGASISGFWTLVGSDAIFATAEILAGQSYSFSIQTSLVADLLAKTDPLAIPLIGAFHIQGDGSIRGFTVDASPSGTTLFTTGTWLPPVDRSGISGYELFYQPLDIQFLPTGTPVSLGTNSNIADAKLLVSGSIPGFAPSNSYRFEVQALGAGGAVTSTSLDLVGIAAESTTLGSTRVSVLQDSMICIGQVSVLPNDRARVCIPPGVLEASTLVTVRHTADPNLKDKKGGGKRFSDVVQFTAEGIIFREPVEIAIRYENPQGLNQITSECATLGLSCEAELFRLLVPLTFDTAMRAWTRGSLARVRVETTTDPNVAIYFARTSHFSSFLVAQSLVIVSPTNGSSLLNATIGQTTYQDFIQLSGDPTTQTVDVVFSPTGYGFSFNLDTLNDRIEIFNTDVARPPGDNSASVAVTIRVTDFASDSTDTRVFNIPITDLTGDPNFAGIPEGVDYFPVYHATDSIVNLSWDHSSDSLRTIHLILVEVENIQTKQVQIISMSRGITSTTVAVTPGQKMRWRIYTESFQGQRSDTSTDFERYTFGSTQQPTGTATLTLNGIQVDFTVPSGTVYFNEFSLAVRTVLATQGTLTSKTNLDAPDGLPIEFNLESGMDLNFSGITGSSTVASVAFTLSESGSDRVYHYVQTATGGGWEVLPSSNMGGVRLWAEISGPTNARRIKISSLGGVGSPFAVGPIPIPKVIKAGGGGGCSVAQNSGTGCSGILNLLLLLFPMFWWMKPRK
jgi:hypothetical protein